MIGQDHLAESLLLIQSETDSVEKSLRVTDHAKDSRDRNDLKDLKDQKDLSETSIVTARCDIDLTAADVQWSESSSDDHLVEKRSDVVIEARKSVASQFRLLKRKIFGRTY